ncbi:flagellar brake protein [Denitratisoma sp. agr-D3]
MSEIPDITPEEPEKSVETPLEPSDYDKFLLHAPKEILLVLKSVIEHGCHITVFFNEGKDLLLTTLIAADEKGLLFDYGSNPETNRRALEAGKLFCITSLNKVKVQFILKGLRQEDHGGRPAFRGEFPQTLLRLQRREYYRLTTPVSRPLTCLIPLEDVDGQTGSITVQIADISGGGVALVAPPESVPFAPETEFPDCQIHLPDIGNIIVTLRVKSVFEVTLRSGTVLRRSGCEFVNLPDAKMNLIQRYIVKHERERKARESGLA